MKQKSCNSIFCFELEQIKNILLVPSQMATAAVAVPQCIDIVVFRILQSDWPREFFTLSNYKFLNHLASVYINMQKLMLTDPINLEIWQIYKSCNLLGWEHFKRCKTKNLRRSFTIFFKKTSKNHFGW